MHSPPFIFLDKFLQSRRQGSSLRTIEFYECCLRPFVDKYELTTEGINQLSPTLGRQGVMQFIRMMTAVVFKAAGFVMRLIIGPSICHAIAFMQFM